MARVQLSLLVLAASLGAALAAAIVVKPQVARAQVVAACAQWEVASFAPNTDDYIPELLPLGLPRPFAPAFGTPFPQDEESASVVLPVGWEPIGFGAASGQLGEAVVLARRCS
jgi:hypothetical protein